MTYKVHTVEELRGHALELAAAFDVNVFWDESMTDNDGGAIGAARVVVHKPITDETSYAGFLHEVGHCVDPLGHGLSRRGASAKDMRRTLVEERAAWEWAQQMAEQFGVWTPAMEQTRAHCLETYESELRNLEASRAAAAADRAGRPSEKVEAFVGRAAADVPPAAPAAPPKFSRRESVGDFMKRRTE